MNKRHPDAHAAILRAAVKLLEACKDIRKYFPKKSSLPTKTKTQVVNAIKQLDEAIEYAELILTQDSRPKTASEMEGTEA